MKTSKLPKTDSIRTLAAFWDTHDLTGFEQELEEVNEPVFARTSRRSGRVGGAEASGAAMKVTLQMREARAIRQMAKAKGVSPQQLVRTWVRQKVAGRSNGRGGKH